MIVTGKSLECRQNVRKLSKKMSEKCPKIVQRGRKHDFRTFFDNFCLFGRCFCFVTLSNPRPLQAYDLYRANERRGRGGFGLRTVWTPSGDPRRAPEKQTVGTVTASHKMLTLQALSSSLNASTAKGGLPGPRRGFWVLSQSRGQNSGRRQNLASMAPWKPFLGALQNLFLRGSPEGNSGSL